MLCQTWRRLHPSTLERRQKLDIDDRLRKQEAGFGSGSNQECSFSTVPAENPAGKASIPYFRASND
jgi:hypothetical protein